MTEKLVAMSPPSGKSSAGPVADISADRLDPGGLLKSVTKLVIETALEEEMSEHLGYDKHATEGRNDETPAMASGPRRC